MLRVHHNQAWKESESPQRLRVSLLVAFYQNLEVLRLLIASLRQQSLAQFELLICDDGSAAEIREKLLAEVDQLPFPVCHLWHEDRGWRKNRILNWGVHFSRTDYLVFVDQDCILHPAFLQEHFTHRQEQQVLCGRRMDLIPWVSKALTVDKIASGYLQRHLWWLILAGLWMKDNNGVKAIHLSPGWLRSFLNRKYRGIVGCNFSLAKEDLSRINGFDTRYEGPGTGEDSDIEFRLSLIGVKMKSFIHSAIQYHVYHPLKHRPSQNESIFAEVKRARVAQTAHGLSQQLSEVPLVQV